MVEKDDIDILKNLEFSFLDNKNVCCGFCGEIVPYKTLTTHHLPQIHKEIKPAYLKWLADKLQQEKRVLEKGYKMSTYLSALRVPKKRKIPSNPRQRGPMSKIRVNPTQMSLKQLEEGLIEKMAEKLERSVPVTLIDKTHAKCGVCNVVISLNKKFEIAHLVRHFNCWHPSTHSCAGNWLKTANAWDAFEEKKILEGSSDGASSSSFHPWPDAAGGKPLSSRDFAVVEIAASRLQTLQCIWCGFFVDAALLAQHFDEKHTGDVRVPKCHLCTQEVVLSAKLKEQFSIDLLATFTDLHHIKCMPCSKSFKSEFAFLEHVQQTHLYDSQSAVNQQQLPACHRDHQSQSLQQNENGGEKEGRQEEENFDGKNGTEDQAEAGNLEPEVHVNSRMVFGKGVRPKRSFVKPSLRQAVPINSMYIEPIAESHWKCKLCKKNIYGAVISAAAIRHYKKVHGSVADALQFEVCQARLEKMSDGCLELIESQQVECLLCEFSLPLHQPFNVCRAVRHLKTKHQRLMPEYANVRQEPPPTVKFRSELQQTGSEVSSLNRQSSADVASVVLDITRAAQCDSSANLARNFVSHTERMRPNRSVVPRGSAVIAPAASQLSCATAHRPNDRSGTVVLLAPSTSTRTNQGGSEADGVFKPFVTVSPSAPFVGAGPSRLFEPSTSTLSEARRYHSIGESAVITLSDGMTVILEEIMDDNEEEVPQHGLGPHRQHQQQDATEQFIMQPMDHLVDAYDSEEVAWAYGQDYGS